MRAVLLAALAVGALPFAVAGILDWARADRLQTLVNIPWLPYRSSSLENTSEATEYGTESQAELLDISLENETRCYDELGCLNVTREWYHLIYRPFNVFPLPRSVIGTRFILYTRKNPTEGQVLRVQNDYTIRKSNFDPKKPTKMIIHGFIDTPLSNWVKEMRRELIKHSDWNVIVVDWAGGSLPLYTQATANTRLVGLELAYFVNYLEANFGLDPGDVHMIGHSLGAHTAGYAGERINGLGRITGLDPAEPYFQGLPTFVRLDPSDAKFVDVIHTDGKSIFLLGYGMSQPCGHIDFYPNNGKEQPGCDLTETPLPLTLIKEGLEEASRVLVACNHIRAIKLFTDSINGECPYIAHRCDSYQKFLQGQCFSCHDNSSSCAIMGLRADEQLPNAVISPGSKYFVTTGKEYPYCQRHYKVTVELAQPQHAESWVQGFMRISLHSDTNVIKNLDLTPSGYVKLQHGQSRTFVVTHPMDVGPIRKVEFYWQYDMDVLQPRSLCFFWCNDHLYVSKIEVAEVDINNRNKRELEVTSELCTPDNRDYADIASRSTAIFYDNCNHPS
ncbi:pancreatic triacylglycerol lipase-like isoform X1 [Schistocerca americana]|uniref:pancreatic triacylglycerol lipase-like isoform X1 n=1 Tax=Schistocerca americana TaxID=7009 RepID=UPI001F4FAE18|nr:pancreatic triacylglycerol lipase-like isoform X1 [Schistocerca americana]XP_046985256.1 pancreatic triacylglycerol lipase-like isoform X1 [Schistocerca americana]